MECYLRKRATTQFIIQALDLIALTTCADLGLMLHLKGRVALWVANKFQRDGSKKSKYELNHSTFDFSFQVNESTVFINRARNVHGGENGCN